MDYATNCLKVDAPFVDDVKEALSQFIDELISGAQNEIGPVKLYKKFLNTINEKHQLTSLRSTDREVMVEVMWAR
jgi:hypothetical protein